MFSEAYSRTFFSFGCSFRRVWPEELPRLFSAQVARLPPNALHSAECIAENLDPNILTISSSSSLELEPVPKKMRLAEKDATNEKSKTLFQIAYDSGIITYSPVS